MKRLLIWALMATMCVAVPEMAWAQKTVTYTFKGRAQGFLLPARPIDLVASGSVPAGVSVSKIDGISYVEVDTGRVNNVAMDGFLGSALLTEYVVNPQNLGRIYFDGFRYEIADIKWSRCSEIAILTSEGTTTAKNYSNSIIGSFEFNTKGDGTYSTGGELFYHTRDFIPNYDYATQKPAGLGMLEVKCTSKQAQHGIAIKDFKISYYEPVITIGGKKTEIDINEDFTITPYIDPTEGHPGAFTNAEIVCEIKGNETDIVDVSKGTQISAEGPTKGAYPYTLTGKKSGTVTVIAKIVYGGQVVSQTSYRLKVGKVEWEVVSEGDVYSTTVNANTTSASLITGTTIYQQVALSVPEIASISQVNATNTRNIAVQKIAYNQILPPYSSVTASYSFNGSISAPVNGVSKKIELIRYAHGVDPLDPIIEYSTNDGDNRTATTGANAGKITSIIGAASTSALSKGATQSFSNETTTYTIYNSDKAGVLENKEYMALISVWKDHTGIGESNANKRISSAKIEYDKTKRNATYTYYAYITYNGNGANGGSTGSTITGENSTNGLYNVSGDDVNRLGMKTTAPTSTETVVGTAERKGNTTTTVNLDANGFTRLNDNGCDYVFMGWNTDKAQADAGVVEYADGASFCPYDSETEGGKGPVTLYAVWNKIPNGLTDPDADYLVYAVFANGGTFSGSKDHLEGVFVTGQDVSIEGITTKPERTGGYTLVGYYDNPDFTGDMVFDANGARQSNATTEQYFTSTGKWKATSDVFLYAKWNKTASRVKRILTFDANGGTMPTMDGSHPYNGTQNQLNLEVGEPDNNNVAIYTPTLASNKFAGWYTNATGDGDGTIPVYNANGESVVLESMSKDPVSGANVASYNVVNDKCFGEDFYFAGSATPFNKENFTVFAHWVPVGTAITFDEGAASSGQNATYKIGEGSTVGMDVAAYDLTEYDIVNVKRTLKTNAWNTVCFPCDIYKDQVAALFSEVKQFNSYELTANNDVLLKFKDVNIMAAGVPYFVKMKEGIAKGSDDDETPDEAYVSSEIVEDKLTQITLENVQVNKTPGKITVNGEKSSQVIMYGSYTTKYHIGDGAGYAAGYDYYYLQNDKFYKSGGTYKVQGEDKIVWGNNQGFRIYLAVKGAVLGGAKTRFIVMLPGYDGFEEVGIDCIDVDSSVDNDAIFDLSGRKLSAEPRKGFYIKGGKKYFVK